MNKQAGVLDIIVWLAGVFVIVFFLAGWMYFHNTLTNALLIAGTQVNTNVVNLTYAVQGTFVPLNSALSNLHTISFILLVTLAFSILIENFYVRRHPIMFFVHFLIISIAVVGAIYISNAYDILLNNNILSSTLQGFTASNFIVENLPWWVAVIGVFGLILLVINAIRDPEIRGGGV